jgi:hypothetical protein
MFDPEELFRVIGIFRRYFLLIIIAVFAVILSIQALVYLRVVGERDEATDVIQRTTDVTTGARSRVEQVEADYKAAQETVPPADLQEIDVFRAVRRLAGKVGLDTSQVTPSYKGTSAVTVNKITFQAHSFTVEATGDSDSIWKFVQAMDGGDPLYETMVVDLTEMSLGETDRAAIEFTVYAKLK